jgi:transcriptional regulator GlxA family with amidase domain
MLVDHLRTRGTATVAGACTGTFALAEAGLLDGRRATTSWWLAEWFHERYPKVHLDMSAMVVADDRVTTAGAAFAHVDLALHVLRGLSPELADMVARYLVVDQRAAQSSYIVTSHLVANDEVVRNFDRHVRAHLANLPDIAAIASVLGTNRRTLERRVRASTGHTPNELIQRIRVERAKHLARTTGSNLDQVALQVGYASASSLRRAMRVTHPR